MLVIETFMMVFFTATLNITAVEFRNYDLCVQVVMHLQGELSDQCYTRYNYMDIPPPRPTILER
jgi:hypothetical protein